MEKTEKDTLIPCPTCGRHVYLRGPKNQAWIYKCTHCGGTFQAENKEQK